MKAWIIIGAIIAVFASCVWTARAATLEELTTYALAHSPQLAAQTAAIKSSEQLAPQAASLPDPTLGINYQSDTLQPNLSGELSWIMLSASQQVVLPAKLYLRRRIAEIAVVKANADYQAARSELIGQLAEGYIELALTQQKLKLLSQRQQLAEELVAAATARYRNSAAEQQDVLTAQQSKSVLQLQIEQLRSDMQRSMHALMTLSGMVGDMDAHLPEQQTLTADAMMIAASAQRQSAALAAQKAVWDGKVLEVQLAEEERYPDYTLNGGIAVAGGMPGMWNAGVQISVPINMGNKQNRAIAQAEADAAQAEAQYNAQALGLSSSVHGSYATYLSASRILTVYNSALKQLNVESYNASLAAYASGKNTISNVLEQLNIRLDYEGGYWEQYAAQLQAVARIRALTNENLTSYEKQGQ